MLRNIISDIRRQYIGDTLHRFMVGASFTQGGELHQHIICIRYDEIPKGYTVTLKSVTVQGYQFRPTQMICMRDLSTRFHRHSNKYTMCTVQNDQVANPLMGPFSQNYPQRWTGQAPCSEGVGATPSDPRVEKRPHLLHWDLIFCESKGDQLVIGVFKPSGHLAHTPCPCRTRLYGDLGGACLCKLYANRNTLQV